MGLHLSVASTKEIDLIHTIQVQSFKPLYLKYQDMNTNPSLETLDDVKNRLFRANGIIYTVLLNDEIIGAICVVKVYSNQMRISPMFLKSTYQNKGYAKSAVKILEEKHPMVTIWELQTIKEEPSLVHFYEKLGYKSTGVEKRINEKMTLVTYRKLLSMEGRHA
ncbi:GNAT family N-acetyltransferase [Marinilactibacillus kalidii]|uniref:GNAT family N-acetyltransferase n=1 Tax=Marinilactibacillus kalidii TaxID=2820274 RepID=UPI001ABE6E3C|nr:GNAT family N-acetyltransferase [Marinilactibacillus kalidii]